MPLTVLSASVLSSSPSPTPIGVFLPLVTKSDYLNYGRKGVGDPWQCWGQGGREGTNLDALDFTWFYDWNFSYLTSRDQDRRYVRMLWCDGGFWQQDINLSWRYVGDVANADYTNGLRGRVWLVYNEPDAVGQCNRADASALADHFSDAYDVIKANDPTARVFGGGLLWLNTQYTRDWWTAFVGRLEDTGNLHKLEGVHIHLYPKFSTAPTRQQADCATPSCVPELAQVANDWYQTMQVGLGLGDRPIWISETGWLGDSSCTSQQFDAVRDEFMEPWSQWFANDSNWPYINQIATNPGYDAVVWFDTRDRFNTTACTHLLDALGPSGQPTSLGALWNDYQP
jgi:hypothetical protein